MDDTPYFVEVAIRNAGALGFAYWRLFLVYTTLNPSHDDLVRAWQHAFGHGTEANLEMNVLRLPPPGSKSIPWTQSQ